MEEQVRQLMATVAALQGELQRQQAQLAAVSQGDMSTTALAQAVREMTAATSQTRKSELARVGKPEAFTPPAEWHDWEFSFLAYLGTIDEGIVAEILRAKGEVEALAAPAADHAERSRLTLLTKKAPCKIVRGVGHLHGYEAYRRLSRQYGAGDAESSTGLLLHIMRFSTSGT